MSIDALRDLIPAYAKDISLNLGSLASETVLNDQQKWGCFVASAHAIGVGPVVKAIEAQAATILSPEALNAAKSAAARSAEHWPYCYAASVSPPTGRLQAHSSSVCRASTTRRVSAGARPTFRLVT